MTSLCTRLESEALSFSLAERIRDVVRDAQLIENEIIVRRIRVIQTMSGRWLILFSWEGKKARPKDPPQLGEHTLAILRELGTPSPK